MVSPDTHFMTLKKYVGDLLLRILDGEIDIEGISSISFDVQIIPQFGVAMIDTQDLLYAQLTDEGH